MEIDNNIRVNDNFYCAQCGLAFITEPYFCFNCAGREFIPKEELKEILKEEDDSDSF